MKTYQEVIKHLEKQGRQKHLLLGNGFSMAYDSKIFSYNALSNVVNSTDDNLLKRLFDIIKTKNFESIMQQLENFCELAKEFSEDNNLETKIQGAANALKINLMDAITELHPEHVFQIPEENSKTCANFLANFLLEEGNVFTTNYDILAYWVLLRNDVPHVDGFGRKLENEEECKRGKEAEFSELIWGKYREKQNVHYVHGALPLFDTGIDVIKAEYKTGKNLLSNIKERIENTDYPIFVTAGDGEEKLRNIRQNPYLFHCYNNLCKIEGSLITFGFNFGEYDEHIIDALNKASRPKRGKEFTEKLLSIYIGVFSEDDKNYIEKIQDKFKCKVHLYDAKTIDIWGNSN